jgi:hypothetical protein
MKKFVLIDHSLKDLGGHYYTYASCVLPAAAGAGLQPILAMHRDFRDFDSLPPDWQRHAVFRQKSYSQPTLGETSGWWSRLLQQWRTQRRRGHAQRFAADCAALFAQVALSEGDHVFMATASGVDLEGLATFLQAAPAAYRRVHWHLQFHLGIFEGRDPDYAGQRASRELMRDIFLNALRRIAGYPVHFYCTTRELTAQYQFLDVAPFQTLPYPVHPLFLLPTAAKASSDSVRIACLGHSRREKGFRELPIVVRQLWSDYLSKGRAQLVMQTERRDVRRELDSTIAALGAHSATPPVIYAPFPLELERYAELVRSSDIGMLLYDSTRYYARCSGVLLEMLSAGVPVIVPGGCWLSEQIHDENQRHLRAIATAAASLQQIGSEAWSWQSRSTAANGAVAISFTQREAIGECAIPAGARSLLLRFRWLEPTTRGTYAQLDLEQLDERGAPIASFAAIAGPGSDPAAVYSLFHLHEGTRKVRLKWRNAWDAGVIRVDSIECRLFADHHPAGSVGLTATSMDQSGELLGDILLHIEHYRRHSAAFAQRCAAYFNADQIVTQLLEVSSAPQPVSHSLPERLDLAPQASTQPNTR